MPKVLIIEDDVPYRKVYTKKFEVAGYTVESAADGAEGLEKMRSFKPDIVFTDIMMPKMDGFQVLQAAKADPALRDTPFVVLTNLSTSGDGDKALQEGALDVLVKSDTEPNAIVDKSDTILGRKKAA